MESPTKEQILAAAKTSKEAKAALVQLFPTVFEEERLFDLRKLKINTHFQPSASNIDNRNVFEIQSTYDTTDKCSTMMAVRGVGKFMHKGFYLANSLEWTLEKDDGEVILVPRKKIK